MRTTFLNIWASDIIIQRIEVENRSLNDYFIPNNAQLTTLQKELIAEKIKRIVLNSDLSLNIKDEY
jgi:hypothetical protein